MKSLEYILKSKYPEEQIIGTDSYEVIPTDASYSRKLVFDKRRITLARTRSFIIIDQRIPTTVPKVAHIVIIFLISLFIAVKNKLIPVVNELAFPPYFVEIFTVSMILILIIAVYGEKALHEHPINIKYYPKEWVVIEKLNDHTLVSINSQNSFEKEVNNYKYQGKSQRGETNIYNIIKIENKNGSGTYIQYKLK